MADCCATVKALKQQTRCPARRDKMAPYFNPNHFAVGQSVICNGFNGVIVRHYHEGMWECRLPGGLVCVSGANIIPA